MLHVLYRFCPLSNFVSRTNNLPVDFKFSMGLCLFQAAWKLRGVTWLLAGRITVSYSPLVTCEQVGVNNVQIILLAVRESDGQ